MSSALITACNSSEPTDSASALDTGDVALLITDAPTSAYDEIIVEAEQVSLIGEGRGREAHLMKRPAKFNLLDLRNTFRRLSKSRAPVGTYSKVRFKIKNVELIKRNRDGHIIEHVIPRLEKNMIDLNARTQFAVDRLRKLVVKLDLDADGSLGTDPDTGDPVFDPDATVDVDSVPTDTEAPPQEVTPVLMNELGDVQNLQTDSFELCNPDISDDCVQVNVSDTTVVMGQDLAQVTTGISGLNETFQWQVFGHLDVTTDTINALQVIEHSSQHRTYSGTLSVDVVNDRTQLSITVPEGEPAVSYPVTSVGNSGIYDSAGNVLDVNALSAGVNVEVIGMLNGFAPFETLKPGVIIISDQQ